MVGQGANLRVRHAFEEWAAQHGLLPVDAEAAEVWRGRVQIMLQGRAEYLGQPDATLWRSGDLHRLLMDNLAPRQADGWDLAEHAVDTLRDFLRFLDDTERLHPGSTRVATLRTELDRAEAGFDEAMADPSRHRLAKRVWTAIAADGLSFDADPAEIDRWAERFSALDAEGRRPVLRDLIDAEPMYGIARLLVHGGGVALVDPAESPDKSLVWPDLEEECDCGCADRVTPPLAELPSDAELSRAVVESRTLRVLLGFGEWAGARGRPVDRRGEPVRKELLTLVPALGLADLPVRQLGELPAVATLWALALDLDVLSLRRTRVIAGSGLARVQAALSGDAEPAAALALWDEVHDGLVDYLVTVAAAAEPWVPHFLGNLYHRQSSGEFDDIRDIVSEVLAERGPGPLDLFVDGMEPVVLPLLLNGLSVLAEHGAVELAPVDSPARVRLTALGRRIVYRRLTGSGTTLVSA
ncbi:hypothetical protein [Amycolatopsis sp. H20-H5]|uniref:hypothetical protein n=1 Tax=Amycolatopsis sp. H20-H5 TaxID=3046309 RepID=UPI002DBCD22A|nr:hypothetical protein [Amycolatopsis sp. H20-H5]MEC3978790.1 hypothetical protein [Amycolatopsis sp. H20-H5]